MADALADLFSADSPPPSPRRANPLFFSPGESPSQRPGQNSPPPTPPPPINFDDLARRSPSEDAGGFSAQRQERSTTPLGGGGGYDFTQGVRPVQEIPDFARAVQPVQLFQDPLALLPGGDGDGDRPVKKRRVVAKIDQERLTSEKGIPALMKIAKRFKPKGKGHEAADLRDLLSQYQLWAHGMFPKGDFAGTVSRVETICRTKPMEIVMKGYKEAFYPAPRSPSPMDITPRSSRAQSPIGNDANGPVSPTHSIPSGSGARRSSEPLFDNDDEALFDFDHDSGEGRGRVDEDDGPDLDELLAMEEMEREGATAGAPDAADTGVSGGTGKELTGEVPKRDNAGETGTSKDAPPAVEEEDEWGGLYD